MDLTGKTIEYARWTRTDPSACDAESDCLALVQADDGQYYVQVTTGPELGDDFVGVYTLDGDQVQLAWQSWELVPMADAPKDLVDRIESEWESGGYHVARLSA